jgi:hypothetical protein
MQVACGSIKSFENCYGTDNNEQENEKKNNRAKLTCTKILSSDQ